MIGHVEPFVREVADARGEAEAERVAQGEDMVGEAVGVRGVFLDAQVRLVVEQPIEHMRRVPHGGGDHLGVEGRVLIGDMRIERHAGLGAVAQIDLPRVLAVATDFEVLPVRGGRVPRAPVGGEGYAMLPVDQFGQPLRVGLVPDVPRPQRVQLGERRSGAGLGHLRQPEVDRVGEDHGEEQRPIAGRRAGAEMGEVAGEVRPADPLRAAGR